MRKLLFVPAVLGLAGLAFVGCSAIRSGKTMVKYDQTTAPIKIAVHDAGTYGLFSTGDVTVPKARFQLKANDELGFERDDQTGQVLAIAGDQRIPLTSDTNYYWQKL